MRHVYERLFRSVGRDLNDYLELAPLHPVTRYFWPDGTAIDAWMDEAAMYEAIRGTFGPEDADGYRRFMRYARRLHEIVGGPFLYRHKPGWRDLLSLPLADVLKIDALRTMHQAISSYFKSPHLVQLFDRFATYNGSSPYRAPATLNVIAYVEMAQGAWYPKGESLNLHAHGNAWRMSWGWRSAMANRPKKSASSPALLAECGWPAALFCRLMRWCATWTIRGRSIHCCRRADTGAPEP